MEFFTGHDINGDGKNDIYIRHKGQGDPLVVLFMFALIVFAIGLSYGSFTLFRSLLSDQKDFPASLMAISFVGSFIFVGIFVGWLCGQLGRSYFVPFGALGLFFIAGFLCVRIINMEPEAKKREAEAIELKNNEENLKFLEKIKAIKNRIKPIQEKLTAYAVSRGWDLGEKYQIGRNNPEGDNYNYWIYWSGSRHASFFITAMAPPPLQDLEIKIHEIDTDAYWKDNSIENWKVSIKGYTSNAADFLTKNMEETFINERSLINFKPGKLKDLANELAGYIYSLKVAAEKASKEIDQEDALALEAEQQKKAKDRDNELKGWVIICVMFTGFILAIFGLVFFLKRKNKLTTIPPTPVPPQDKPAIITAQRYKYTCSGCGANYKVTGETLGNSFRCKKCSTICWVPMDVEQLSIE